MTSATKHFDDSAGFVQPINPPHGISMQQTNIESEIVQHFRQTGIKLAVETHILDDIVQSISAAGGMVNNKAIILHLIAELDGTSDPVRQNVLRNILEIVVGRTPDDEGF